MDWGNIGTTVALSSTRIARTTQIQIQAYLFLVSGEWRANMNAQTGYNSTREYRSQFGRSRYHHWKGL